MVADSLTELHGFTKKIGLKRQFYRGVKKKHPHYDLIYASGNFIFDEHGEDMISKAISFGAVVVDKRIILEKSKQLVVQKSLF